MNIQVVSLSKSFENRKVLDNISINVEDGELFCILGPSGCGKTTFLKIIAGLIESDSGEIFLGSEPLNKIPAHKRNIGLVFQQYALWPHMTVFENVAYGLKNRGLTKDEIKRQVEESLKLVRIDERKNAKPAELSGGQQQRVALARALAIKPNVLLFDEPLSSLDFKLRAEMREELRRIQKITGITSLYVTHDQKEAFAVADRVAIMNLGRVEQVSTSRELYFHPASRFVAEFVGEANWLEGRVLSKSADSIIAQTPIGNVFVKNYHQINTGDRVLLGIRPERILITEKTGANCFTGVILNTEFLGDLEQITVQIANKEKPIKVTRISSRFLNNPQTTITIYIDPQEIFLFRL